MNTRRFLPCSLILLPLLQLAGCSTPELAAPKSQVVDIGSLAGGRVVDDAARQADQEWPGQAWWTVFGDPQLNQLVERAEGSAPSLAVARARIDQALAATGVARAAQKLKVEAGGSFSFNRFTADEFIPPPYGGGLYWDNQVALKASYDLDLWGSHHQAIESALDHVHAAEAEMAESREVLASTVLHDYIDLAQQYETQRVLQAMLDEQAQILDLSRKRLRAGLGTQLEVAQAESELPATRALIDEVSGNIAILKNQLAALTGQGPGAADSITAPTLKLDQAVTPPATIPARWIGRRPDVIAARWHIEADGHDIEVAKDRFYPDVNLSAFAGFQALGFSRLLTANSSQYAVTPAISLPIFEGGQLQAGLDAKAAARDADVASYNETVLKAMAQVADQLVTLDTLNAQEKDTNEAQALAKRANDLALTGLRAGLTDYTHVLETSIALLAQQRKLAQVHAARLEAQVALIHAVGGEGGVQGPADKPAGNGATAAGAKP